jgi:hypothetical protein
MEQGENKNSIAPKNKSVFRSFFGQEFFQSGLVHWILIASLFVNLANWGVVFYFIRPVDFPIILHYNVYFGVDILGSWWEVYFLPSVGTFFWIINFVLGYFSYQRKERIATYLFLLGAFIIQIGLSISIGSIIKINF